MRIFVTPSFNDWSADEGLTEVSLCKALQEMEAGLIDAHLGGELVKKRVANGTKGKSGGWRTVIAYRQGNRAFFLHGFAKNEKANVTKKELEVLRIFGKSLMNMLPEQLDEAVKKRRLVEVKYDV